MTKLIAVLLACAALASCAPIKYFGRNSTEGQMTDREAAALNPYIKAMK